MRNITQTVKENENVIGRIFVNKCNNKRSGFVVCIPLEKWKLKSPLVIQVLWSIIHQYTLRPLLFILCNLTRYQNHTVNDMHSYTCCETRERAKTHIHVDENLIFSHSTKCSEYIFLAHCWKPKWNNQNHSLKYLTYTEIFIQFINLSTTSVVRVYNP